MAILSRFNPINIVRFIARGVLSYRFGFYAGSTLAIVSHGGLVYVTIGKLNKWILPAAAASAFGTIMAMYSFNKIKYYDDNRMPPENFKLVIPPEDHDWALNEENISRSLDHLASEYERFMLQNVPRKSDDDPNYKLEFAENFADSLVAVTKHRLRIFLQNRDRYKEFKTLDEELDVSVAMAKQQFKQEGSWHTLFFQVLSSIEKWAENMISSCPTKQTQNQ